MERMEPEDTGGQGSLACLSPRGGKESDTTQRLNRSTVLLTLRCLQPVTRGFLPFWFTAEYEVPTSSQVVLLLILILWVYGPHSSSKELENHGTRYKPE